MESINLESSINNYLKLKLKEQKINKAIMKITDEIGTNNSLQKIMESHEIIDKSANEAFAKDCEPVMDRLNQYVKIIVTPGVEYNCKNIIVNLMGSDYLLANFPSESNVLYLDEKSTAALSKFEQIVNLSPEVQLGVLGMKMKKYYENICFDNEEYELKVKIYNSQKFPADNKVTRHLFKSKLRYKDRLQEEINNYKVSHDYYEENKETIKAVLNDDKIVLRKLIDANIAKFYEIKKLIEEFCELRKKHFESKEYKESSQKLEFAVQAENKKKELQKNLGVIKKQSKNEFENIENLAISCAKENTNKVMDVLQLIDESKLSKEDKDKLKDHVYSSLSSNLVNVYNG